MSYLSWDIAAIYISFYTDMDGHLMDTEMELAIQYLWALRSEINLRIQNHTNLTISKIAGCAALLGYLVSNNPAPLVNNPGLLVHSVINNPGPLVHSVSNHLGISALISVPVLAFGLDLVIYHNLRRVNDIGKYIHTELEIKVFRPKVRANWVFFEKRAQGKLQGLKDIFLDRLGQIAITILFTVLSFGVASPLPTDICRFWQLWPVLILLLIDVGAAFYSKAGSNKGHKYR